MCKILKKVLRKRFFQKRFVLMFATFVSRIKQNKLFLQASNQRLYKRQLTVTLTVESINGCTSVDWTVTQALICLLHNVDSMIQQASTQ